MDYTITELTNGNAVVTFADGAWANVPVLAEDTKEVFEEKGSRICYKNCWI